MNNNRNSFAHCSLLTILLLFAMPEAGNVAGQDAKKTDETETRVKLKVGEYWGQRGILGPANDCSEQNSAGIKILRVMSWRIDIRAVDNSQNLPFWARSVRTGRQ